MNVMELATLCYYMDIFCLPNCGLERVGILVLAVIGLSQQVLHILSLRLEEAHVVGLVQSSLDILVSFTFQVLFFQNFPSYWKMMGAVFIFTSVVSVGIRKIGGARKLIDDMKDLQKKY